MFLKGNKKCLPRLILFLNWNQSVSLSEAEYQEREVRLIELVWKTQLFKSNDYNILIVILKLVCLKGF